MRCQYPMWTSQAESCCLKAAPRLSLWSCQEEFNFKPMHRASNPSSLSTTQLSSYSHRF